MPQIWEFAKRAADRIEEVLRRGRTVATGAAILAGLAGLFCLVAVAAAVSGSARTVWIVIGLVPCAIPAGAALLARRSLTRASAGTGMVADFERLVDDPAVHHAVAGIDQPLHDRSRLLASGRRLWALRNLVADRKGELTDLWVSLVAITRLPLLTGVALVGAILLCAIGVVALVVAILN